jgi:hypothetical protein
MEAIYSSETSIDYQPATVYLFIIIAVRMSECVVGGDGGG